MGLTAAVLVTVAQLADLVTSNVTSEVHPVGAALLSQTGYALIAKVALISLICAVAEIAYRKHVNVARFVLFAGIAGGLLGTWSNS